MPSLLCASSPDGQGAGAVADSSFEPKNASMLRVQMPAYEEIPVSTQQYVPMTVKNTFVELAEDGDDLQRHGRYRTWHAEPKALMSEPASRRGSKVTPAATLVEDSALLDDPVDANFLDRQKVDIDHEPGTSTPLPDEVSNSFSSLELRSTFDELGYGFGTEHLQEELLAIEELGLLQAGVPSCDGAFRPRLQSTMPTAMPAAAGGAEIYGLDTEELQELFDPDMGFSGDSETNLQPQRWCTEDMRERLLLMPASPYSEVMHMPDGGPALPVLLQSTPNYRSPPCQKPDLEGETVVRSGRSRCRRPLRLWCHIYLHMQSPGFDLVPRLIGRGGSNMRRISKATGAKLRIRGKGSGHLEVDGKQEAPTPLMLAVTTDSGNLDDFRKAMSMSIEELRTTSQKYETWLIQQGRPQQHGPHFSIGLLSESSKDLLGDILSGVPIFSKSSSCCKDGRIASIC